MISPEVREEAIEICATMASSSTQRHLLIAGTETMETPECPAWDLGEACAIDESPVHRLVSHMFKVVTMYRNLYSTTRALWAEAEALLRTGFDPEIDDVVQLESGELPSCTIEDDWQWKAKTLTDITLESIDQVKIDYVPVDEKFNPTDPRDIEGLL